MMQKLTNLNEWFVKNMPEMSDKVATNFIPVWNDAIIILKDFGSILKMVGGDFSYLMGVLDGDDSIKDTKFSVENLGEAFKDLLDLVTKATLTIGIEFKTVAHLAVGVAESVFSAIQGLKGNGAKAQELSDNAYKELMSGDADIRAQFDPSLRKDNPDFAGWNDYRDQKNHPSAPSPKSDLANLSRLEGAAADKYHIPPELLSALIHQESGEHPLLVSPKGAKGLTQFMDSTAAQYGLKNPFNEEQSVDAGAHYLSDLLKRYHGDFPKALAAYNAGPGAVDHAGGVPNFAETQNFVKSIMSDYRSLQQQSDASGGQVIIHGLTVVVPPGTSAEQSKTIISDALTDTIKRNNRNTMAQTAGGAYF